MTKKQLEDFVAVHNHYPSAKTPNDLQFTIKFFKNHSDADFKALAWKADMFDSDRFISSAGDYVMHLMEGMDVAQIQQYLNIVDDYTPEERIAMEEHPLEFFAGIAIQHAPIQQEHDDEPQPGPSNDNRYF